ncbi:MAG: glucoamylase family protein [Bacillota bacterium]
MKKSVFSLTLLFLFISLLCSLGFANNYFIVEAEETDSKEIEELLELKEEKLLEEISQKTFDYFWEEANPENGLIKDRSTDKSPASIAAVGFGLSAIPVAVERGWIDYEEGKERVLTTLETFAEDEVEGKRGFYYHFVNMETGEREWESELSSIDTALFLAGALTSGQYFSETEIAELADSLYEKTDWEWMLNDTDFLCMGWKPDSGFLEHYWNSFNEGLLAYVLAIGSPTHPIPAESWNKIKRPQNNDYIYVGHETLFVYQYPLVWLDLKDKEDKNTNYFKNAVKATEHNYDFTRERKNEYQTYDDHIWGLSASDGPDGYQAYGAARDNHDGTVAPYASIAALPFKPELSLKSIRAMLEQYGTKIWSDYGFVSAFNADQDWFSDEYIGIDQGDILLMIENYRSELVWDLFMEHQAIQQALKEIGFEKEKAD